MLLDTCILLLLLQCKKEKLLCTKLKTVMADLYYHDFNSMINSPLINCSISCSFRRSATKVRGSICVHATKKFWLLGPDSQVKMNTNIFFS